MRNKDSKDKLEDHEFPDGSKNWKFRRLEPGYNWFCQDFK